jgi:hypothetical protein
LLAGPRYLYEFVNGHLYGVYPIGTAALAAPAVLLLDRALPLVLRVLPGLGRRLHERAADPVAGVSVLSIHDRVEVLIASLVVALSAVLAYYVALRGLARWRAVLLALAFAFCTPAWSTASRALWQHGPSMLSLALALLLILKARERPVLAQFASIPLAYSFICRPTNVLPAAALTLFVFLRHRRQFVAFLAWGLVVAAPFVVYSLLVYHSPLPPYYFHQKALSSRQLLEGLAGTLFSPSRGLFVFSPVLFFSVWGAVLALRGRNGDRLLSALIVAALAGHWVLISAYPDWYGGHSVGPRYFSDVVPLFVYFLVPAVSSIPRLSSGWRAVATAAFVALVAVSFFANLSGATNRGALEWNGTARDGTPADVDTHRSRLWDWSDPQFLRGIVRR